MTYATLPSVALAPEVVAWQKGFYKKYGLDVQFKMFQSGATTTQALLAGAVDIAESGAVPFLNGASHGAPLQAVLTGSVEDSASRDVGIYVRKTSGITSLQGLRGKTIAINATGNMENMYLNLAILPKLGFSPRDVKIIEVPYANMQQILDHGQVDAAIEFGPFAVKMNQDVGLTRIVGLESYSPSAGYPLSLDVTKKAFVSAKPDIIRAWRTATQEGLNYMKAHPAEAAQLVSAYIHLPASLIATTLGDEQFQYSTGVTPAWTGLVNDMQKAGFIPSGLQIGGYMAE